MTESYLERTPTSGCAGSAGPDSAGGADEVPPSSPRCSTFSPATPAKSRPSPTAVIDLLVGCWASRTRERRALTCRYSALIGWRGSAKCRSVLNFDGFGGVHLGRVPRRVPIDRAPSNRLPLGQARGNERCR